MIWNKNFFTRLMSSLEAIRRQPQVTSLVKRWSFSESITNTLLITVLRATEPTHYEQWKKKHTKENEKISMYRIEKPFYSFPPTSFIGQLEDCLHMLIGFEIRARRNTTHHLATQTHQATHLMDDALLSRHQILNSRFVSVSCIWNPINFFDKGETILI